MESDQFIKPPQSDMTLNFIENALNKHGNKYGYDNVIYESGDKKVQIFCKKCNKLFEQTPRMHLRGCGCKICGIKQSAEKRTTKMTKTEFINLATSIHKNHYDYSNVIFTKLRSEISIICKSCNLTFIQRANNHLSGQGCSRCHTTSGVVKFMHSVCVYRHKNES